MGLQLLTFCNKKDDRLLPLIQSCEEWKLDLKILEEPSNWGFNTTKLKLLNNYLPTLSDTDFLLVVDAFDVVIHGSEQAILERFAASGKDILFSAEANYYFREPTLSIYYWKVYPRAKDSVYHFLNSGSFMGRAGHLKKLLKSISDLYQVDFQNNEQLLQIRSDQYLYSRFYVDHFLDKGPTDFSVGLDHQQELFACTGGRMSVAPWPATSQVQDYLFFKFERRMLKTFGLKAAQEHSRDLQFEDQEYVNRLAGTRPLVIHLPGTYEKFTKTLKAVQFGPQWTRIKWFYPVAVLLSGIAYVRSLVVAGYIQWKNGGKSLGEIYPFWVNQVPATKYQWFKNRSRKEFPVDNPFVFQPNPTEE